MISSSITASILSVGVFSDSSLIRQFRDEGGDSVLLIDMHGCSAAFIFVLKINW